MMKRKGICYLLTLCMVFGILAAAAQGVWAAGDQSCGASLIWSLSSDGTLTIRGTGAMRNYDGSAYAYIDKNPSILNNLAPWFSDREKIKRVVIEDGVTGIGNYAFFLCSNLSTVTIPTSVIAIGAYAFRQCKNLGSAALPSGVFLLGSGAFSECENLTDVNIPARLTEIGDSVFFGCSALTSIDIPNNIKTLGDSAFENCAGLTKISLPDGLTTINASTFCGCRKLADIKLPSSVSYIGHFAFDGTAYYDDPSHWVDNVLYLDSFLLQAKDTISGTCKVKSGTKVITPQAFEYCDKLTAVELPEGLQNISDYAFQQCTKLARINLPNSLDSISSYAFTECSALNDVTLPANLRFLELCAFAGCSSLTDITIPSHIEFIDQSVFAGSGLTRAVIAEGNTEISAHLFQNCTNLKEVTIPYTVKNIYGFAFDGCNALTKIIYTGDSASWDKIDIELYNDALDKSKVTWNTKSLVQPTASEDGKTVQVSCIGIPDKSEVVLALYQGRRLVGTETATFDGTDITFHTDKPYSSAKVMAWKGANVPIPVCDAQKVIK